MLLSFYPGTEATDSVRSYDSMTGQEDQIRILSYCIGYGSAGGGLSNGGGKLSVGDNFSVRDLTELVPYLPLEVCAVVQEEQTEFCPLSCKVFF